MILSMTGYGRSDEQNEQMVMSVEIRAVNSRYLDFAPRLPRVLQPFEDDAYKLVKKKCERGRVALSAKLEYMPGANNGMTLNNNNLKEYMMVVKEIQKTAEFDDLPSMGDILRLPDIFTSSDSNSEDKLKKTFLKTLGKALAELNKIRLSEGKNIQKDIEKRLGIIEVLSKQIQKLSANCSAENMVRYKEKIQELIEDITVDESRLVQEAAILSDKRDITEELVRLNSHIELFKKNMDSVNNEGKKLNFLLQEMGREINTIGSKTDLIEISHLVVDLKDELEKIREQVQNII